MKSRLSRILPFPALQTITGGPLLLPFYHLVGENQRIHVKHLYQFKSKSEFIKDLDFFSTHFHFISFEDVLNCIRNSKPFPRNSILLSFDDGLSEIYNTVAPILKQKGIPAIFFLNSAFLDNKKLFYRFKASLLAEQLSINGQNLNKEAIGALFKLHQLDETNLKKGLLSVKYKEQAVLDELAPVMGIDFQQYLETEKPFMTSDNIRSLIKDGFHIGSHSVDHPPFKELTLSEQYDQAMDSTNFIREHFGLPYGAFAFPFGESFAHEELFSMILDKGIDVVFGTNPKFLKYYPKVLGRISPETSNMETRLFFKQHYWSLIKSKIIPPQAS
jgi:peptidoglycan/xylan/chitin deacetylase (PgdA/CDA1 family)